MDCPKFQHDISYTGCYDCDENISQPKPIPTPSTALSKIENNGNTSVNFTLLIKIQKLVDNGWGEYINVVKGNYQISPGTSLDLKELFNNQNVTIKTLGNYRLNVTALNSTGQTIISGIKEFNVTGLRR